ncbi:MAG: hypothetical protein KJ720_03350 [Proteobacteria bacterium]|nr:hypothetical protein [Pseudomonadota bacterium]MBU1451892.1 hypothetical protein [Pseudomonadota bacterium]MBU2470148.1 hypothetical protein [Pseudomonadota bacterium]MBU2517972.1 hypothetical protein [Pseudomonadota bacterium]
MQECPLLSTCGFFAKYQENKSLACRGFINRYCRGAEQDLCKRKQHRLEHGTPPSDDMMPNGRMIADLGELIGSKA